MASLEERLSAERAAREAANAAAQAAAAAEQWGGRRGGGDGAAAAEAEAKRLRGELAAREEALAEASQQLDLEREQISKLEHQIMFQVQHRV